MSIYLKQSTWIALCMMCALLITQSTEAASFDCAKAATKVEKFICADTEISKLDEELSVAYKKALQDGAQAETVKQVQKQWMKGRNGCADVGCVKRAYEERLSTLSLYNGDSYTLVMSKDTKLCNAMLALYNEDMKAHKNIRYDLHEMFTNIQWQTDDKLELTHASFDINNDGKNELVIKVIWHLHGNENENLYIYPAGSDVLSKLKPDAGGLHELFDNPNQLFSSTNNAYYLKVLPETSEFWVGGLFILQPFIWDGTSYISMTDMRPRWIVIAKYKQAIKMQDICYFFNPNIKHLL